MSEQHQDHIAEVRQFFWRNYVSHSIEGGLFIGGMAFLAGDTVMPSMIKSLGGPEWLIALMPVIMSLGFMLPQLLTAHRVEQLQWVKPFVMFTGIFQRTPYLAAALALFLLAGTHPMLTLAIVAATPLVGGIAGGLSFSAWIELISKIIPERRRSSAWAVRYIIGAAIGIGAGSVIRSVLRDHPGPAGYAMLHLHASAFLWLSYLAFAAIRETRKPPGIIATPRGLHENLRSLPHLLRSDIQLRRFLGMRVCGLGLNIMIPFLAIYALRVTGHDESFLGHFVTAQMTGGIIGNLLAGYLGDRYGGKLPVFIGRVLLLALSIAAVVNRSETGFVVIFFTLGFAVFLENVGATTLSIELCPHDRRPTYMAFISAVIMPCTLLAAAVSTVVRVATGGIALAAALSAALLALSFYFLVRLREPRHTRAAAAS